MKNMRTPYEPNVEEKQWLERYENQAANSRCPASAGYVPLGVYRKAQHALAHGAKESQVENMINDWLRENDRPANFSFTQNK